VAVASFEDLCAGFCELVKIPAPLLQAEADGRRAFHVVIRGETVNLVHIPDARAEYAFILFELGRLPSDPSRHSDLLDANFNLLELHPPLFCRNPATGDALLQCVYPLFEATPAGLYELVNDGVELVNRWREDRVEHELGHEPMPGPGRASLGLVGHFA
jgi:hypothetical protein